MFGLPFSPWLAGFAALSHRMFWIAPIMLVLAIEYHRGTLSAVDSMTLFYLFSLATAGSLDRNTCCGLCPCYL